MSNSDDEREQRGGKKMRIRSESDLLQSQPGSSRDPEPSLSILDMTVRDLVFKIINDVAIQISPSTDTIEYFRNLTLRILHDAETVLHPFRDKIGYFKQLINSLFTTVTYNCRMNSIIDWFQKYEFSVLYELDNLYTQSSETMIDCGNKILENIDTNIYQLNELKSVAKDRLLNLNFPESLPSDNVVLEEVKPTINYPVQYDVVNAGFELLDAVHLDRVFTTSTLERVVRQSLEENAIFQNPLCSLVKPEPPESDIYIDPGMQNNVIQLAENYIHPLPGDDFQTDYTFLFGEIPVHVTSLKVMNNLCIIGCFDGTLVLGSLESREIIARIKAHVHSISSIIIWQKCIFTTSLDCQVRCFNLDALTMKSLRLTELLTCADDDKSGILYAGTNSGSIYQFNMLAMTIISPYIQIGRESIDSIKILTDSSSKTKMIVASNNQINLRECDTGNIILNLRFENVTLYDYCPQRDMVFGVSNDAIYKAFTKETASRIINLLPFASGGSAILCHDKQLIVADGDGLTQLLNEDLESCGSLLGAPDDTITLMTPWKNNVISYFSERRCLGFAPVKKS